MNVFNFYNSESEYRSESEYPTSPINNFEIMTLLIQIFLYV